MRVLIDDTIYKGTAAEIIDQLRSRNDDRNEFADRLSYIRQLQRNFVMSTHEECVLPDSGEEDMSRVLLFRFADVGSLEVLPDD